MTTVVFPGKFDPLTLGHLDVITRAAALFHHVVVAVFTTPERPTWFTTEERMHMIRQAVSPFSNVETDSFQGLLVDYARRRGAQAMVRGLRLGSDFEYEFEMALMNRRLFSGVDTICLITSMDYQYVRSSLLKEVARLGGEISGLAPPHVVAAMRERAASFSERP